MACIEDTGPLFQQEADTANAWVQCRRFGGGTAQKGNAEGVLSQEFCAFEI